MAGGILDIGQIVIVLDHQGSEQIVIEGTGFCDQVTQPHTAEIIALTGIGVQLVIGRIVVKVIDHGHMKEGKKQD